jgi:predicted MPP superfamily phosphohydrolase
MSLTVKQVAQLVAGSACLTGLGTLYYANQIEARQFRLETVRVTTGGGDCPKSFWRILHLSDLHLCHPEREKIDFLRKITQAQYDLVLLTGDVFENFTGLPYALEILSRQPKLGAYAVLGNHDYYNYTLFHKTFGRLYRRFRHPPLKRDVEPFVRALERGGFTVLRNSSVNLKENGIFMVGIDYPTIEHVHLRELMSEASDDQFKLVLFHVPVFLDRIRTAGAHLAVGGHTHGGQVRLPGYGAIITDSELPRHEASGLFFRGKTAFHISRGLGADPRSNIRLFCPPAATVIEVAHHQPAGGAGEP